MSEPVVRFICNVCGAKSAQPILCTRDECPTDILVNYAASPRKQ